MNYLDTNRSVIISSPAGSGKTEKLARRYISLLQSGVEVERILAVTFTDRAAAEMKQRILRILKNENINLFNSLLEKMSLMRVTTIHSFCATLLRRFSFEAGIDPNYRIENAIDSRIAWEEIIYGLLMETGRGDGGHELFMQTIGEKGFRGLAKLNDTINYLFEKRPFSLDADAPPVKESQPSRLIEELRLWEGAKETIDGYEEFLDNRHTVETVQFENHFLTKNQELRKRTPGNLKGIADYRDWAEKIYALWRIRKYKEYDRRARSIRDIFRKCLKRYSLIKTSKAVLDFSDLEYIAFRMLTGEPEWANILYAFDEKTDHILVDEFQDTNNFQWAIIDKLTEEWRSGLGAKRDEGIKPTIFLVGDEKQSIYFFRGANVEIFRKAREKLQDWLGDEFYYEEMRENYRSAPAIIDFTNSLFSNIMAAGEDTPAWITGYGMFDACRKNFKGTGKVEIIILDGEEEGVKAEREKEADIIARRIKNLTLEYRVSDRKTGEQRGFRYMDAAILLRKRTHLKIYEEALRVHGIPFIVVKGIGFYQEPEVAMLRAFVYFLTNPKDDYSLYVLLKSPFFMLDEGIIIKAVNEEPDCLLSRLSHIAGREGSLPESNGLISTLGILNKWLALLTDMPLAELIERALVQTGAWGYFHEAQKHENIKKFIRLIESLESEGRSILRIRAFLESTIGEGREPKANVNTEGMDAVKIMTIHAAKGLEFPVVFIPGIEESYNLKTKESLIYEDNGRYFLKSIAEPSIRRGDEDFRLHLMKEEEEQKRLFYVAVTRAEEALFLVTRWREKGTGFLRYLKDGIGLDKTAEGFITDTPVKGLSLTNGEDVVRSHKSVSAPHRERKSLPPADFIKLPPSTVKEWKSVTGGMDVKARHGMDWTLPGEVLHKIFEGISKETLKEEDIGTKADKLFEAGGIKGVKQVEVMALIEKTIAVLKKKGIWQEVVLPGENSFSELPFNLETEEAVYSGRIDRVIKKNNTFHVYDYKTFPVNEDEMELLMKEYYFQLSIYKKAVQGIFNTQKVKSFILFTHSGEVREVV